MSLHRKFHHTDGKSHKEKYLLFFKSQKHFTKCATGSIFNMLSRVISGVVAAIIVTQFITNNQPSNQTNTTNPASSAAAVVGGSF